MTGHFSCGLRQARSPCSTRPAPRSCGASWSPIGLPEQKTGLPVFDQYTDPDQKLIRIGIEDWNQTNAAHLCGARNVLARSSPIKKFTVLIFYF
jgi:hypothetical protein